MAGRSLRLDLPQLAFLPLCLLLPLTLSSWNQCLPSGYSNVPFYSLPQDFANAFLTIWNGLLFFFNLSLHTTSLHPPTWY